MSILVKGMNMPRHCGECGIDWCNIWRRAETPLEKRPSDCPLVEVPTPHGRLIDADALIDDVRRNSESYFADDFAHEWVDKAPTIIPADDKDINVHNKGES